MLMGFGCKRHGAGMDDNDTRFNDGVVGIAMIFPR